VTAADSPRLLPTVGWFVLGLAWLWLVSALADAALSSMSGVGDVIARSAWARAIFLLGAAFTAAAVAIAVARRHRRWGAETLRAAWIVGAIDIAMGLAAVVGVRNANPSASIAEGAGFLAAALVFSVLFPTTKPAEVAE